MLKALSILVLSFFFTNIVRADRFSLNHEKFVHLTNSEKDAFIVSTMEFMVDLEARYELASSKYGEESQEAKKYSFLLKKFNQLFISEAHAATTDLAKYGTDFEFRMAQDEFKRIWSEKVSKTLLYN